MRLALTALLAFTAFALAPASASADDEEELLLLPGQGELRDRGERERRDIQRLKPGGGLFMTFDVDTNGAVTPDEISRGIPLAFTVADANEDGYLTALEQQDWARSLPTRDDSLANPVRFDPNLDRRVDLAEFTDVISKLGLDYANAETGNIMIAELKAPIKAETGRAQRPDANTARTPQQRRAQN